MTLLYNMLKISIALGLICALPIVNATPMHSPVLTADNAGKKGSLWAVEVFHDPHTTQSYLVPLQVCFQYIEDKINPFNTAPPMVSTQDKYNWCSSYGWDGFATKEGDQIFMNSSAKSSFLSGVQWELSSKDEGAGHWRVWKNDPINNTIFDLNAVFTRTTETCSCK